MKRIIIITVIISSFITGLFGIQLDSKDKFSKKKPVTKLLIKENGDRAQGILSSPLIIPAKFYGEVVKDESGDYTIYIEKLKYITSWANGWTHGEHEASGIIVFKKFDDQYKAVIKEDIEIWELKRGEIRYFDDYYRGDEGLQKVKDRITRIKALVGFLKDQSELPEYFERVWFKSNYCPAFNKSVKKILLNKNTKYPEALVGLHKSGTVERDIEESIEIFFMEYNMSYYFKDILNNSLFDLE